MYGIRIGAKDVPKFFHPQWTNVVIEVGGTAITINLSRKFWEQCPELRSAAIGAWMVHKKLAPWAPGHPAQNEVVTAKR